MYLHGGEGLLAHTTFDLLVEHACKGDEEMGELS
jgi:hypothetical protein